MNRRFWGYAVAFVVLLGLVLLWGITERAEIPLVQVQDLISTDNWTYARVRGTVARYPDYDPVTQRLTFWIDDDTGLALVVLDQSEHQALFERGQVPTIGDRVAVAGTIVVRATDALAKVVVLTVSVPEQLEVERPAPLESSIANAAAGPPYRKVLVQGEVYEVWQPYGGLTVLRIRDRTGEIDVVYDQNLVYVSGLPTTVFPGDLIRVRGAVASHLDRPQIVLDVASGLQRLPAVQSPLTQPRQNPTATAALTPAAPTHEAEPAVPSPTATASIRGTATVRPIATPTAGSENVRPGSAHVVQTGQLSQELIGHSVTVEARITRATLLSAGCSSIVDDGSGPATVWLPNALYEQLVDPEAWNVGGVVRVTGSVSEYEGELEVVPQDAASTVIVQRAPAVVAPNKEIGSLSVADVGRRVTVEATVVGVDPFSAGTRCTIDDGSGQVTLLLWQNVFEALPDRAAIAADVRIRASGWVDEYRGELEIVPGVAYDVVVLGGTGAP